MLRPSSPSAVVSPSIGLPALEGFERASFLTTINDCINYCNVLTEQPLDTGSSRSPDVAVLFEALAEPAMRQVVELLGTGPKPAGDLAAAVGLSPPAMSRHLRVLLLAGIVTDERTRRDARLRLFRLRPTSMDALQAWLDQIKAHWDEQLASFRQHVEERQ
jgi:DNA-binding transcriptional ArsR family regulator